MPLAGIQPSVSGGPILVVHRPLTVMRKRLFCSLHQESEFEAGISIRTSHVEGRKEVDPEGRDGRFVP